MSHSQSRSNPMLAFSTTKTITNAHLSNSDYLIPARLAFL
jgi:hypothetical protein